jgi:hypothetical protein
MSGYPLSILLIVLFGSFARAAVCEKERNPISSLMNVNWTAMLRAPRDKHGWSEYDRVYNASLSDFNQCIQQSRIQKRQQSCYSSLLGQSVPPGHSVVQFKGYRDAETIVVLDDDHRNVLWKFSRIFWGSCNNRICAGQHNDPLFQQNINGGWSRDDWGIRQLIATSFEKVIEETDGSPVYDKSGEWWPHASGLDVPGGYLVTIDFIHMNCYNEHLGSLQLEHKNTHHLIGNESKVCAAMVPLLGTMIDILLGPVGSPLAAILATAC